MSSISFHSLDQPDLQIGGSERAYMGVTVTRLAASLLDLSHDYGDDSPVRRVRSMLAPGHYLRDHSLRGDAAEAILTFSRSEALQCRGRPVSGVELALNTVLSIGSDALCLVARLHGQCEIHAYLHPEDRPWLADLIDEGVASGVLRRVRPGAYGTWTELAGWLRAGRQYVVTSYSVCRSFPDVDLVTDVSLSGDDYDRVADAFYSRTDRERWDMCLPRLHPTLRLDPRCWRTYRFGHRLSVFDLLADDWRRRFDEAPL